MGAALPLWVQPHWGLQVAALAVAAGVLLLALRLLPAWPWAVAMVSSAARRRGALSG